jgi:hypothetical protein
MLNCSLYGPWCVQYILSKLSFFEQHPTATGRATSVMLKLFVAQCFNTAFLVLLINANADYFQGQDSTPRLSAADTTLKVQLHRYNYINTAISIQL